MSPAKKSAILLILAFAVTGCALGLPYNEAKPNLPKLAAGKSRVFVYRIGNVLAMAFPRVVYMDLKPFGDTFAGTSTYRDVAPGAHAFSFAGQNTKLDVQLRPGDVTFLQVTLHVDDQGIGDTIIKVMPRQTAERDMHYTNLIEAKVRKLVKP